MNGIRTQVSDSLAAGVLDRDLLREKLAEIGLEGEVARDLAPVHEILEDPSRTGEALRDALSTRLMDVFRVHRSRGAFGLLYELNQQHLLVQVASRLRRYGSKADPGDVLQEVFFNIYRYPHRFNSSREDAFRVWTATIVRNTVLKHLRASGRSGRFEVPFEDLSEVPETRSVNPLRGVIENESVQECHRVYLTYLHLYLRFYSMLSHRERRAIHLVEVDGASYREAAADLGIKLENLKMVIFRARRKIHRAMRRVFDGLPPDCRPARDPRPVRSAPDPVDVSVGEEGETGAGSAARERGTRAARRGGRDAAVAQEAIES